MFFSSFKISRNVYLLIKHISGKFEYSKIIIKGVRDCPTFHLAIVSRIASWDIPSYQQPQPGRGGLPGHMVNIKVVHICPTYYHTHFPNWQQPQPGRGGLHGPIAPLRQFRKKVSSFAPHSNFQD